MWWNDIYDPLAIKEPEQKGKCLNFLLHKLYLHFVKRIS